MHDCVSCHDLLDWGDVEEGGGTGSQSWLLLHLIASRVRGMSVLTDVGVASP
jgi:hypothetical protein